MTLLSPYDGRQGQWYRGNLHAHTTGSDGQLAPADLAQLYVDAGRDFLAITDHDVLTLVEHPKLVLLPGVEVSADGPHLLAVGRPRTYDPHRPRPAIVAEIVADGALCILNHPNWGESFEHWRQDELEACAAAHGIEVYNTIIEPLQGSPLATDRWDRLWSAGQRLWGYANDDWHDPRVAPRATNIVLAAEPTPAAILEALKAGACYASTGVVIDRLEIDDASIFVAAAGADHIRFLARHGTVQHYVDGPEALYRPNGHEGYVRVECWGPGHRFAFTQPIEVQP
jgi:hypothetical protein